MAIKCKRCVHRSAEGHIDRCDYQQNTGHCKIVTAVRADGTEYKTVSPVENCAFFEPGRRQKPAVETWRLPSGRTRRVRFFTLFFCHS